MQRILSARLTVFVLVAYGAGLGCGVHSPPPAAQSAAHTAAPRAFELPAQARPMTDLPASTPPAGSATPHHSIIVLYEQLISPPANAGPRIVAMAATPDHATSSMIREPGAKPPEVREPDPAPTSAPATEMHVAEAPRSSQYVPIEAPPPTTPVVDSPPPQFSAQPAFDQPQATPHDTPPPVENVAPEANTPRPVGAYAVSPSLPGEPAPQSSAAPPSGGFVSIPVPAGPAALPAAANPGALRPVAERAAQISDRGFAMAQRGMLFAGREELIKSLQLVAEALDVQERTNTHAAALASGLAALREARDFASSAKASAAVVNVDQVASTHRTTLLRSMPRQAELSPVVAQQQYLAYAQSQLALAAGQQPVASQALYRLGRLQTLLAAHDDDPQALHAPQAMAFHQAALSVDSANSLAANELGVLLARYGQLEDARRLLLLSVSVHPQVETWHNLAAVHRRLGEADLAQRAESERELLAKKTGSPATQRTNEMLRWVDPATFAASGGKDIPWPEHTASKTAPAAASTERR